MSNYFETIKQKVMNINCSSGNVVPIATRHNGFFLNFKIRPPSIIKVPIKKRAYMYLSRVSVQGLRHVQRTVGSRRHATNFCKKNPNDVQLLPIRRLVCLRVLLMLPGKSTRNPTVLRRATRDCDPLRSGGRFVWHHECDRTA